MFKVAPSQKLILASASPRRKELLHSLGLEFQILVSDCDESLLSGETPQEMVKRLALDKATTISAQHPDAWVLGADTTVVVDHKILGKPSNEMEATEMLQLIQGREHLVWGAFALINLAKRVELVHSASSEVQIRSLSAQMIARYIATGEPMDKAGSYAIQGIGASLVQSVRGSYSNVVGLDLAQVLEQMLSLGVVSLG